MSLPQPAHVSAISQPRVGRSRAIAPRRRRLTRQHRHRALAWEVTGRLAVNLGLSLVALSAVAKLVPYHQAQRQALRDLNASVEQAEIQTSRLKAEFSRYFDPAQTSHIIQEQGGRESEKHIPIVWVDRLSRDTATP